MQKLVLFDIDGTILNSSGAGRVAMERALYDILGMPGDASYHYDGKTDKQIVRELMKRVGYEDHEIDTHMDAVLQYYLEELCRELGSGRLDVVVHEGVHDLINLIDARTDAALGLLTGNIEAGARVKLSAAGFDFERFVVNAFGSDHEARHELPAIARRRMQETFGVELVGRDVVVIGDTPADITCGRALGVRAIAVATGRYSVEDLRAHAPFAVFDTLRDTDAVLAMIDA